MRNIADTIYEVLRTEQDGIPISLEEHIQHGGHAPQGNSAILLRAAARRVKRVIQKYLESGLGIGYVGTHRIEEPDSSVQIDAEIHGRRGDTLIDVVLISTQAFSTFRPPAWAVLSAAAKATWVGAREAIILGMDRDNQEWASWRVTGDLPALALQVESNFEEPVSTLPSGASIQIVPLMSFASELDEYLLSLNKEESHRRQGVFHPSEISTTVCDRALAYGLNEVKEKEHLDPKVRRIFAVGHCYHDLVQAALRRAYPDFREEVPIRDRNLRIMGSCDGQLDAEDGVEIKSIGARGVAKLAGAKPEHKTQGTIYGACLDLRRMHYLYVAKETGKIHPFEVPVDRTVWHQVATRATRILRLVESGSLPEQIDKDYICERCKFAWTCKPNLVRIREGRDSLRRFQ